MLQFALSLVGAAIGAWIAATFAFSRYRKERSLDRVVDWNERVVQALHRMQGQIEDVRYWERRHGAGSTKAQAARQAVIEYLPEFRQVTGQRVLYALSGTQMRIAAAEGAAGDVASIWKDPGRDAPVPDLVEAGELMWQAAHQVGVALRKELGLEHHLWEGPYDQEIQVRRLADDGG